MYEVQDSSGRCEVCGLRATDAHNGTEFCSEHYAERIRRAQLW